MRKPPGHFHDVRKRRAALPFQQSNNQLGLAAFARPGGALRLGGFLGFGRVRGRGGLPGGNAGTVFKLDTTGTKTVLHSFGQENGNLPLVGLVRDSAGNLYGTVSNNHSRKYLGVVFKLKP